MAITDQNIAAMAAVFALSMGAWGTYSHSTKKDLTEVSEVSVLLCDQDKLLFVDHTRGADFPTRCEVESIWYLDSTTGVTTELSKKSIAGCEDVRVFSVLENAECAWDGVHRLIEDYAQQRRKKEWRNTKLGRQPELPAQEQPKEDVKINVDKSSRTIIVQ